MTTRMRIATMDREELIKRCEDGTMYADFVPIGKWEYQNDYDICCSECGKSAEYFVYGSEERTELPNFCPNCGADMREGDMK